jgi:hypothetical protein
MLKLILNKLRNPAANWKYILASLILVSVIFGGIFAWQYWKTPGRKVRVPEEKIPEARKQEKISEKLPEEEIMEGISNCENLPTDEEQDECMLKLAPAIKNPELCKKIEWEYFQEICEEAIKISKLIERKEAIPSDIINSDKNLEKYIMENFTLAPPISYPVSYEEQPKCIRIVRGNFDEDPSEEIVIAIFKCLPGFRHGLTIVKEKGEAGYVTFFKMLPWKTYINKLNSFQILRNHPKFIILETTTHAGTAANYSNLQILTIGKSRGLFQNQFETVWEGISVLNESISEEKPHEINIDTEFKDLDNDGNLEIIRKGNSRMYNGATNQIEEKKIYQILKWNEKEEKFIEISPH